MLSNSVAFARSVEVKGIMTSQTTFPVHTDHRSMEFRASMDDQKLLIVSISPPPGGGRYEVGACKVTGLNEEGGSLLMLECDDGSGNVRTSVSFERSEYITDLANGGGTLQSLVYLALKGQVVDTLRFPISR
jgi:hypothetical protein